jgi:hypothetical protein
MRNTQKGTLDKNVIVSKSGRVFRSGNKELLDSLPPDMVSELARRRLKTLEEIEAREAKKPARKKTRTRDKAKV